MRIRMAFIKLINARENRKRVIKSDINEMGAETGEFITIATVDIIQAAILLLREILEHDLTITQTDYASMSFKELVNAISKKYNRQPWLNYFKTNSDKIEGWLNSYQLGNTITLIPGQYGILYDNVKDLYNTVLKEFNQEITETYDERIRYKLFDLDIPYSVEDIKFYLSEKEITDDEELTRAIIFAQTLLEQ